MPDMEKVIQALECCKAKNIDHDFHSCDKCNYNGRKNGQGCDILYADALALLKEQEYKDKMFHALEEDWKRLRTRLKEQEELLHKKQKDIDRLCVEISELKHQKHDKRIPYLPDSNVQWT